MEVCENKYGGYGKECKNIRLNVIKNEPHVNTKLKTGKITFPESLKKCLSRRIFFPKVLQSTLGFETLDKAAALGLETATPLTDPRQYINSNLGFRNLKI